ncbi:MAG: glycosyltransferase family 2 protein, partial [Mycetocola sp.]
ELEPGAIDSWLALADRDDAVAVIPRLRHVGGKDVPTPPVRPGRRTNLDGVRDRLSYRSAPLGLVSTREFGAERFVPGLGSGEDVAYSTAIWFGGLPISFDRHGPAYLIHSDAGDRVTMGVKPVSADVAFMRLLIEDSRFVGLSAEQRLALVIKLLRIHIFGIVTNRPSPAGWTPADRLDLAEMTGTLLGIAPAAAGILSRADGRLLDAIQDPAGPTQRLLDLGRARRRFARPASLLPGDLRHLLAREAPLRMITASALVRGLR